MIGQLISHYKILEKLGEGGMGVVYKAHDTRLDRLVAIKFLPRDVTAGEEDKARFAREAKAAASLIHPNVATIFEFDEAADASTAAPVTFLVMEYIEGITLRKKISGGPLAVAEVLRIAGAIAAGLSKAHEKGIIHRDIKSDNVMLSPDGDVKIMDFGLAEIAGRSRVTKVGTTVGTISYMSPEQGIGEKVDQRTDIWSLGVVLYEMLTGKLPFESDYEQAVIYRILNEEPAPVDTLRQEVPPALGQIVKRAMEKDRAKRYQQVSELLAGIQSVAAPSSPAPAVAASAPPEVPSAASARRRSASSPSKSRKFGRKILYAGTVAAVLLMAGVFYFWYPSHSADAGSSSIAVLPFRNMSDNKADEYFSDGMTEELINALAQVSELHVPARTSVFKFKGVGEDIREIGKQLNVRTVLEGTVRKASEHLRIIVHLINVADGFHIWSETFDRDEHDVFAIQEEISQAIVNKLKLKFLGSQNGTIVRRYTGNVEAHDLYLKGIFYRNKWTKDGFGKGIDYLNQAIQKDPNYALAYAGLADAYFTATGWYLRPAEALEKANAAARKSLEIDSTLAEAHTAWGVLRLQEWNWLQSEAEFRRAIQLNPKYAPAHQWLSLLLSNLGRFDEARKEIQLALEIDPLSPDINGYRGMGSFLARDYDRAEEECRKTIDLDTNFMGGHEVLGWIEVEKKNFPRAIDELKKALEISSGDPQIMSELGHAYAVSGDRQNAEGMLKKLGERSKIDYISPFFLQLIYMGLGEREPALRLLEDAYAERETRLNWINVHPYYDGIRSDPRFVSLVKKLGLREDGD